ncbi:aspartyl-phosphate phosphatase Spo0E family protein [Brevibacillus sp. MS2.2]|uniref:aspartyl-phosphate phosphatase Spo0E family protein n=1 Tax=Brevibacillus sp. MS2.2 TaxID=2738981 RepID=UPI00156AD6F6|nr:aspartyl-phosphate phosphatase Spo0E family protein [Brevibacillus sp. MS2.2]NRR19432.1 aspartyl-phosphate phosphatase Spo0E family protein [Brevibacillus sp. MS2.2]
MRLIAAIAFKKGVPPLRQVKGTPAGGAVKAPISKCITLPLDREGVTYHSIEHLKNIVEQLREQLVQMYLEKNDFLDDEVVEFSQQLDQYILVVQLKMMQDNELISTDLDQ